MAAFQVGDVVESVGHRMVAGVGDHLLQPRIDSGDLAAIGVGRFPGRGLKRLGRLESSGLTRRILLVLRCLDAARV